eukprot:2958916-Prymnesium_polylepis.1
MGCETWRQPRDQSLDSARYRVSSAPLLDTFHACSILFYSPGETEGETTRPKPRNSGEMTDAHT